jgi:hypothetical protein
MPEIRTKTTPVKPKKPRRSARLTHKHIAKTSPILFVPAFVILVTAMVLGSVGNTSKYNARAHDVAGIASSQKVVMSGLVIDLNFAKDGASYDPGDTQKIINLVNQKPVGVLGTNEDAQDSDPSYDQNGFFSFDGERQLISLDGRYAPKSDFAYEMWVRSDSVEAEAYAISSNDNANQKATAGIKIKDKYWWFMGFNDGNKVYLPYPDKGLDQSWHHLVVTRSDDTIAVYLDGLPAEVTRGINKYTLSNDSLTIGATKEDGKYQEFFKGDIAQLRIYTRALTNAEIVSNIKNTRPDFIKNTIESEK